MLPLNILGNTNIKMSLVGLGTVKFGRNTDVKYPNRFNLPNNSEIVNIISLAQDLGVNTLDTAPAYGNSEQKLGKIFKDKNNNIIRDNWVIISKAGEEYINNQSRYNFSADYINNSINNSLKNLYNNYIDIMLIHSDGSDQEIANNDKLWQVLEYRKQQGDIRAFGVSSKTSDGGIKCLKRSDLAMVTYRQDYKDEIAVLDYAKDNNKGIILKKVLNSGHISNQHSVTDSLKFSSNHPAVTSMIIGSITQDHLTSNIQALT